MIWRSGPRRAGGSTGWRSSTGRGVPIGARAIPGVSIGTDTIVGAGGVVARDLPDGVLAIGVPAKIKGDRR